MVGYTFKVILRICGYGGIGRRTRFRFWWETVQVQVLLPAVERVLIYRASFYFVPYFVSYMRQNR